jgi:hypothetical protein
MIGKGGLDAPLEINTMAPLMTGQIHVGGSVLTPDGIVTPEGWHIPADGSSAHGPGITRTDCPLCADE